MLKAKRWRIRKGLGKFEQGIINPIQGLQRRWYGFLLKFQKYFFKFNKRLHFNLATMLVLEHVDPKELLNLAFTIRKNENFEKRSNQGSAFGRPGQARKISPRAGLSPQMTRVLRV